MKNKLTWFILLVFTVIIVGPMLAPDTVFASDKLAQAIAATPQGTENGQINPEAAKGVYGIPGAPSPGLLLCFLWAIWVGWIFSTVGAFGGIMAGVGHITIYGLGAYAKTFKDTSPTLNKLITDSIRVSNQWLVGLSALVSSINYGKQKRLVTSLGFFLGIGALFATLLVVFTTAGKVKFSQYQGWFGLCVWLIFMFMVYEMSPKGQASKKAAKEAAKAFEDTVKSKGDIEGQGVTTRKMEPCFNRNFLFWPNLQIQSNLGICRRVPDFSTGIIYRCWRWFPVRTVFNQRGGSAHVCGCRDISGGRVNRNDLLDLQFHGA
jgi:hypothetical protein